MTSSPYSVDLVVPCYQEEDVLPRTIPVLLDYMRRLAAGGAPRIGRFRIILVDDGSRDSTWAVVGALAAAHPEIEGVKLSRNYGHQNAMLAGLTHADADAIVTLDADLQDDIEAIGQMLEAYEAGSDLVLGVRSDRSSDSKRKRGTAHAYYNLLAFMGVNIVRNHADFRLTSRRALKALLAYDEVNLFFRGIVPTIGFRTTIVPYARQPRQFGETKYTVRKMIRLALDGITSFSIVPLRITTAIGAIIFVLSLVASAWILWSALITPAKVVPGWASTTLPIFFLSGVQLLSIGIMGEYIGKMYMETKRRPRFFVEDVTGR